jgi:hypothetical protein
MAHDPFLDPAAIEQFGIRSGITDVMYSAWGWPVAEIVHFFGLCLIFGTIGMFDLRMMGLVKGLPLRALHRLIPFGIFGFSLSVVTGLMFVISTPFEYLYNPAWQLKMGFMALAGLNVAGFYLTTAKAAYAVGADDAPPRAARIFAGVSLACWVGVVCCGRVITAFRPPFHWCLWCG